MAISFRLVGLIQIFIVLNGFSAVRYVNESNSTPLSPYSDWSTAATNIQDAIEAADVGDQILVTNGVYRFGSRTVDGIQTNRIALTKGIRVVSVNGPGATFIEGALGPNPMEELWGRTIFSGSNAIRCAYVGSNSILSGFTLTNGYTTWRGAAGGVYCESSGIVSNCVLVENSAGVSGGAGFGGTFYNCVFTRNIAVWGGALRLAKAYNCVIANNFGGELGGGAMDSYLYNCTVISNWANEYGGGVLSCEVYNGIVYHNPSEDNYRWSYFENSCTDPLAPGPGNIGVDPQLTSAFHLQSNSPCINAGYNAYVTTSIDLFGNSRTAGGTVDLGAHEYQTPLSQISYAWLQQYGLPTDGSADGADFDNDGMNSWEEWRSGTVCTNALSVLKMLPPSNNAFGITLSWQSVTNRLYYLQASPDAAASHAFVTVQSNIVGEVGTTSYMTSKPANGDPRFYRVGVEW